MAKTSKQQSNKQDKKAQAMRPAAAIPVSSDGEPNRPATGPLSGREILAVAVILAVGFLIRLAFLPGEGHSTDVGTFESWTLSLIKYGLHNFYDKAGFVDYPPGYLYILAASGWVYNFFSHANLPFDLLKFAIKAPAVLADLGLAYLSFLLVRRTWSTNAGLWALALVVFNPAVWFVSAYWGQGDSVTAVFVVWSVYFMVTKRFELAWFMFAFAVLIKPQPIVVVPALLVWQLRSGASLWRLAFIPIIGFAVAYGGSLPFAPDAQPVNVLSWLYERYHTGTALYPYNSCNAFNLYSTRLDFWQPDSKLIPDLPYFQGWPQWAWGITIVSAFVFAVTVRLWRTLDKEFTQAERESSFYLAMFLSLLGLFMFATRMHERYLFSALAFGPLIFNVSPLNRVVYFVLSGTFLVNLFYALQYLYAPSADLAPQIVHPLSIVNVLCLFLVAGAYLVPELGESLNTGLDHLRAGFASITRRDAPLAWEGLIGITRADVMIVTGLTLVTGALLYVNIGRPGERIFDEIYYARAAQEYIHHLPQFEWTHPPLSKLILTIGALIYKVDPVGARLMSALFGTLTVPLLYAFAKRLFSSTAAAVAAIVLLLSSGYFYVQSRIATPEIFVAFFALATIYCMYRLWIAAQIVKSRERVTYPDGSRVDGSEVAFEFGERLPLRNAKLQFGQQTAQWSAAGVHIEEAGNVIDWKKDGSISGRTENTSALDLQRWAFWLVMTCVAAACVISTKWNGLFDLIGIWGVALAVSLQRRLPWVPERPSGIVATPKRFLWGNAYGFRFPLFILGTLVVTTVVYLLTYIPFFHDGTNSGVGHAGFKDLLTLQTVMFGYHHGLKATHPFSSPWWTWPLELRPVSYYSHDLTKPGHVPIISEVIALPNPFVWWIGLFTVPLSAWLAWRERHKGMMLCVAAYFFQWLPWMASTRIDFQYNFYPNTAIICLASVYVLVRFVRWAQESSQTEPRRLRVARLIVLAYLSACLLSFAYFFPVLSATPITRQGYNQRMWITVTCDEGQKHCSGWN